MGMEHGKHGGYDGVTKGDWLLGTGLWALGSGFRELVMAASGPRSSLDILCCWFAGALCFAGA